VPVCAVNGPGQVKCYFVEWEDGGLTDRENLFYACYPGLQRGFSQYELSALGIMHFWFGSFSINVLLPSTQLGKNRAKGFCF